MTPRSQVCRGRPTGLFQVEKAHGKRNFSSESKQFSEIGGNASLSHGGWTPLIRTNIILRQNASIFVGIGIAVT